MTDTQQTTLSAADKKFWKDAATLTVGGRFVRFTDGEPQIVDIDDWSIHTINSDWGKKECLKTIDGKYLKLESKRLKFLLLDYVGLKCRLEITRMDSQPTPRNTWYIVAKVE